MGSRSGSCSIAPTGVGCRQKGCPYPTARLFQPAIGDWASVVTRVKMSLLHGTRVKRRGIPSEQPALLERAVDLHKQGKLAEAEHSYQNILKLQPDHSDALHLLGTIRLQQQRYEDAVGLITASLRQRPDSAEALSNLGIGLARLGRHDQALASYEKALVLKPDYAEALNNCGSALDQLGRHDEAIAKYDSALTLPDYVGALKNRGTALQKRNRHDGVCHLRRGSGDQTGSCRGPLLSWHCARISQSATGIGGFKGTCPQTRLCRGTLQ